MRFVMTTDGASRLGLDPARLCYTGGDPATPLEFTGPSIREGLLGGFPRGVLGWAKKALKVDRTDALDVVEARLLYYVIAIRQQDHTLLPITRFDDLALTDFELVQHVVTSYDRDGDCGECSMTLDNPVHLQAADQGLVELPPTSPTAGRETTATPTP